MSERKIKHEHSIDYWWILFFFGFPTMILFSRGCSSDTASIYDEHMRTVYGKVVEGLEYDPLVKVVE